MRFDARAAKSLKPGDVLAIEGCPGLRLVARDTKRTWVYRYRSPDDDKLRQVTLGNWPAMPPIEAANKWQELRARRDLGVDVAIQRRQDKLASSLEKTSVHYTLGQMVEDFCDKHLDKVREPKGARAVRQRLRKALARVGDHGVGRIHLTKLTRKLAFDIVDSFAKYPVSAVSVKVEMAAALEFACNSGHVPNDIPNWFLSVPTRHLRSKGQVRQGVPKGVTKRVLKEQELRVLFTRDMQRFSTQVQDFLTLHIWTCARGGEICSMRAEDLEEVSGVLWWTISKERSKLRHHEDAAPTRVPLVGRARAVVERLRSETADWLFPSKTRKGERTYVKQPYMQSKVHYVQPYSGSRPDHVRKRLEVTHWSPHDLRRTGRTMLASMGCPEEVAEAILGHVKPGVVGVYNLYRYDAERVEWLTRLSQRLEEIIGA